MTKTKLIGGVFQTRRKARAFERQIQAMLDDTSSKRSEVVIVDGGGRYRPEALAIPLWATDVRVKRLGHMTPGDIEDLTGRRQRRVRHYVQWALVATAAITPSRGR